VTDTVMWEAKAAAGRDADLLAWALDHAPAPAEVFRSADARVVVIDRTGQGVPEPPVDLLARPAHVWRFRPVPRQPR
jgi:hypothetical protein